MRRVKKGIGSEGKSALWLVGQKTLPLPKRFSPLHFMKTGHFVTDCISGTVVEAVTRHCHSLSNSLWDHLLTPADRALHGALVVPLKHIYLTFLTVALVRLRLNV